MSLDAAQQVRSVGASRCLRYRHRGNRRLKIVQKSLLGYLQAFVTLISDKPPISIFNELAVFLLDDVIFVTLLLP